MIERSLRPTLIQASQSFPVVLITGPRQVGKSTLLESCREAERVSVSLDDPDARALAQADPALFFQKYPPPLLIDEIQYAPELFVFIKIWVDREKKPGLFWLSGSQKFSLMKGVRESLAGRVAILDLLGFSQAELEGRALHTCPFLPGPTWLQSARASSHGSKDLMTIYQNIFKGSFPALCTQAHLSRDIFYRSYVDTYLYRDVQNAIHPQHEQAFRTFLRVIAARTGQLRNDSDIARDVGSDPKTIRSWMSVLEASGLIYLLYPYANNLTKRMIKTPKIYFLDTGLCSYLTRWPSAEALEAGAISGNILETFVFTEILKSYWNQGQGECFYYYRDTDQKEIDLIIESGDVLYPVEFKKTAMPSRHASKNFDVLFRTGRQVGHGSVFCLKDEDIPLSSTVDAIPIGYL